MLSKIVAVLRFVRAPLVVTVWSHLLAGGYASLMGFQGPLWAGFTCIYFFGMAHNDWVDRVHDRTLNPTRPLPSGILTEDAARLILALLGMGVACSFYFGVNSPNIGMNAYLLPLSLCCAVGYNNFKNKVPIASTLLMGIARGSVWAAYGEFPYAVIVGLVGICITLWSLTEEKHPSRKRWTLEFLLMLPLLDALLVWARCYRTCYDPGAWIFLFVAISLVGHTAVRALRKA